MKVYSQITIRNKLKKVNKKKNSSNILVGNKNYTLLKG